MRRRHTFDKFVSTKLSPSSDDQPLIRVVTVSGEITEESAKGWVEEIEEIEDSSQEIIPITISTFGGEIHSFITLYDCIKACQKPVVTFVSGKAMSAGVLLSSCGDEGYRWCAPNASMMIHSIQVHGDSKSSDIEVIAADIKEIERLNRQCYKLLAENCGHKENYFYDLMRKNSNQDLYLSPQEARKHNIVNHVGVPEVVLTVKSSMTIMMAGGGGQEETESDDDDVEVLVSPSSAPRATARRRLTTRTRSS